jgi:hypothetical protein
MINSMNLRTTFNEDAERYGRFRPTYPPELFERLINDTGINSDSSLLEIGPGTGQATKPLAQLAIIHTEHVSDNVGDTFHKTSHQSTYDTYWPPKENEGPPTLPTLRSLKAPFIDTAFFELQSFSVFPEVKIYSAHDYAGLLSTFSHIIALPPSRRRSFLADIEDLINDRFGGKLEKYFAFTLTIAQKK